MKYLQILGVETLTIVRMKHSPSFLYVGVMSSVEIVQEAVVLEMRSGGQMSQRTHLDEVRLLVVCHPHGLIQQSLDYQDFADGTA
jgi:hypothetical protein